MSTKRMNYYDHQFLGAADFKAEQDYHLGMRRLHNKLMHTWGVLDGLDVTATGTTVAVAAGRAIDSDGCEIILSDRTPLDLSLQPAGTPIFITIAYKDRPSDHTAEAGGEGDTRIEEAPEVKASTTAPADKSKTLILAKVTRTGTTLGPFDLNDLTRAGVVIGSNVTVEKLTLKKTGVADNAQPFLTCGGANLAAFNSNVSVNGTLSTGILSIGDPNPAQKLSIKVPGTDAAALASVKNDNRELRIGVDKAGRVMTVDASDLQFSTNNVLRATINGTDGRLVTQSAVQLNSSELYFTSTSHALTNFSSNTLGFAGIENDVTENALLILGRTVSLSPPSRVVKMRDVFELQGRALKPGGGPWENTSDRSLKKNINQLEGALDKLLRLRGVSFEWKDPQKYYGRPGPQMGLVAQEVEEVFPEWVGTDPQGSKTVGITGFEALVVEALRELKNEIDELKDLVSGREPGAAVNAAAGERSHGKPEKANHKGRGPRKK
jgi:hypothetical protein